MKHVTPPTGEPVAAPELTPEALAVWLAKEAAKRKRALQRLHKLRTKAADEIDRLLDFLDSSDIDPDLEPTLGHMNGPAEMDECETPVDDEPSLASLDNVANQTKWADGGMSDAELDNCDDEPSLGALPSADQTAWGKHGGDDREGDGCADDREGDELQHGAEGHTENDEPSLGWTDEEAARGRTYAGTMGSSADLEVGIPTTAPQNRTRINRKSLTVEVTYRRFLRGLAPNQRAAMQERMRDDSRVSLVGGPAWGEKSEV